MSINTKPNFLDANILGQCKILGEDGQSYQLSSFWDKQAAILVFLRHFGCIACRGHATDVWNNREKYKSSGAEIYFIGNGAPNMIKGFKESLGIQEAWIYTDPTLEAFKISGFKRGILPAVGPRSILKILELKKRGFQSDENYGPQHGDAKQLGGIIAIKPANQITYYYASQYLGDEGDFLASK